jgi:threonine dehydratase
VADRAHTFADGLAVRVAIPLAVEELPRSVDRLALVSERELARAVAEYAAAGVRVEGAAAAPLAALRKLGDLPEPVVLVVTGRNIDDALYNRVLESAAT